MFDSIDSLRALYAEPRPRAVKKQLARLDIHCRRFISLSPFVVIATSAVSGSLDASPRGGTPGFVKVADDHTLLLPDAPGNNRLDSFTNVVETGRIGMLFLIPGVDETLRINGTAAITMDPALLERWTVNGKHPRSALRITVGEAYLHCAKALIRSRLWSDDYRIDRQALPSYAQMLKDQGVTTQSVTELQASIDESYSTRLY